MGNNSKRQKELETVDGERSEGKVRKEKTKKETIITMANITLESERAWKQ